MRKYILIALSALLFIPSVTYAEGGIGSFLSWVGGPLLTAILPTFAGRFLDSTWYTGEIFGLQTSLKEIWRLVSFVVYLIFAGILIWLALMNILGREGDNYQLKTSLPKFIISVLLIPFTWFAVQFILTISSILAASIILLPYGVIENFSDSEKPDKTYVDSICVFPSLEGTSKDSPAEGGAAGEEINVQTCYKKEVGDSSEYTSNFFSTGPYGVMTYYATQIFKVQDIGLLDFSQVKANYTDGTEESSVGLMSMIKGLLSVGIDVIVNIIIWVAFALLMVGLVLALVVRIIRIWIYTMMSPVFVLSYYTGGFGGDKSKLFDFKEFIKLAFVPVLVSAALAFGVLFMMVVEKGLNQMVNSDTGFCSDNQYISFGEWQNLPGDKKSGYSGLSDGDVGPTSVVFCSKGDVVHIFDEWTLPVSNDSNSVAQEKEVGLVGSLILKIFSLMVLWISLISAIKYSEITGGMIDPIEKIGTNVGNLTKSIPSHVPVMPGGMSLSSVSKLSGVPKEAMSQRSQDMYSQNKFVQKALNTAKGGEQNGNSSQNNTEGRVNEITKKDFDNAMASSEALRGNQLGGNLSTLYGMFKNVKTLNDEQFQDSVGKFAEKVKKSYNSGEIRAQELQNMGVNPGNNGENIDKNAILKMMAGGSQMMLDNIRSNPESHISSYASYNSMLSNGYGVDDPDVSSLGQTKVSATDSDGLKTLQLINENGKAIEVHLNETTLSLDTDNISDTIESIPSDSQQLSNIVRGAKFHSNNSHRLEYLRELFTGINGAPMPYHKAAIDMNNASSTYIDKLGLSSRELESLKGEAVLQALTKIRDITGSSFATATDLKNDMLSNPGNYNIEIDGETLTDSDINDLVNSYNSSNFNGSQNFKY